MLKGILEKLGIKSKDKLSDFLEAENNVRLIKSQQNDLINENIETKRIAEISLNKIDKKSTEADFLEKAITSKYNNYFGDFLDNIKDIRDNLSKSIDSKKKILNKNKNSVSAIICNNKGEVLFLQRSKNDDFEPETWCLPGGGFNLDEDSHDAVIREVKEETGLDIISFNLIKLLELPKINLFYFKVTEYKESELILDNNEHSNYIWVGKDKWKDLNLILDLKSHLNDIFEVNKDEIVKSLFVLVKAYQTDQITGEDFNKIIKSISVDKLENI